MIIDFHAHPGYSENLNALRAEFRPALRAAKHHGVDWICLSSLADWKESPAPAQVRKGNDAVLALAADHPEEVIGFCYVNPRQTDEALAEIERCVVQRRMAGIKLWQACAANDARVEAIAKRAAELKVPILQHAWYKTGGNGANESTPANVAALAAKHPETIIVMAHLTGAGERGLADVAPYPNVSVDISGGEPEAGMVELAVRRLGARRVLFGTDSPIRSYGATVGKVMGARLTVRQRNLILGENARRLLAGRLGA
ncbi:MAG: amidohydrolase family protein [Armatimonadota bacterium]|nr:MAG: amidohydrolase family protein [Armatimonadota bacterium]